MSGYLWEPPKPREVWWAKTKGWLLAQRLMFKAVAHYRWNKMRRYVRGKTKTK